MIEKAFSSLSHPVTLRSATASARSENSCLLKFSTIFPTDICTTPQPPQCHILTSAYSLIGLAVRVICMNLSLHLRPAPEQIVINACELDRRRMIGRLRGDTLYGRIHVEQDRPLAVIADHALDPKKRRDPPAACHGRNMMQA